MKYVESLNLYPLIWLFKVDYRDQLGIRSTQHALILAFAFLLIIECNPWQATLVPPIMLQGDDFSCIQSVLPQGGGCYHKILKKQPQSFFLKSVLEI